MSRFIPTIIDQENKRAYDIYSKLLEERIVFVNTEVRTESMNNAIAQLLYLASVDDSKDITLYIDSPGGSCSAGLSLVDTMHLIKPDVATVVVGMAASMGSVIASQGAKGKRFMLPHSEHMIHQPLYGGQGQYRDMELRHLHCKKTYDRLLRLYKKATGQTEKQLKKDMDRDNWMDAEQAIEYGLADKILERN